MAKNEANAELDELAFRLYAERIAKMPAQVGGEESSKWAYQKAEDFLTVRERIRCGESISAPSGPQLSDCSAPNLKPTHPHNLVSKRFAEANGGEAAVLKKIRELNDWLNKHPHSDQEPVVYKPLDWDAITVKTARQILPAYCN